MIHDLHFLVLSTKMMRTVNYYPVHMCAAGVE